MAESQKIGVAGLGNMGSALARRLLASGFSLSVFNRTPGREAPLVVRGAVSTASAAELAGKVDILLTCVPDGPDVEQLILGKGGVLAGARPGLLVVECSTIDPLVSRAVGEEVRAAGCRFADAAVGGLPKNIDAGQGVFMVGALEPDLPIVRPVLQAMGQVVHCGPPSYGVAMKLVNNLLSQTIQAADAEALVLGAKFGLDLQVMLKVLTASAADNAVLRGRLPEQVMSGKYDAGFTARLALKDQRLAHDFASRMGVPLFALSQTRQLLTLALAQGRGDQSVLSVAAALEDVTGAKLVKE